MKHLLAALLLTYPLVALHAGVAADSAIKTKAVEFVYPSDAKGIIDVTKAPYFADPSGKTDCTEALVRAIDDMMSEDHRLLLEMRDLTREDGPRRKPLTRDEKRQIFTATELSFEERQRILKDNPKALIGFERCQGVFPARQPPAKILYFPNGTYLVGNTLTYTYKDLKIKFGELEMNRSMHFMGQSRQGTIIRLKDHAPGFGEGECRPVVSFTNGNKSAVAMQNSFENFTIEVGAGNPGAVGLEFFANNTGVVRNVSIRTLDPEKRGQAGLSLSAYNFSCVLAKDLDVEGFDYGVKVTQPRLNSVFEHIRVNNQRIAGFYLEDNNVSLRDLVSRNKVPAVLMKGQPATMALVEGDFSGGSPDAAAVECRDGFLFARDLKTGGYGTAIQRDGQVAVKGPDVDEYVSSTVFTLFPGQKKQSLRLPIEEPPDAPWDEDPKQWAFVDKFGAKADGFTDDTEAIRRAMNSGCSTVFFQPGTYLVNGGIDVPGSVRRIDMMYCDLVAGGDLQKMANTGVFRILGGNEPLTIERLFAFELFFGEHYLIDHASTRTLVLRDLHTQVGAMYRNSVPGGKVFIENVATTDQFDPVRNCFTFTGQKVWARQIDPERADPQILNDGSSLWVLGFKTEGTGCAFRTTHGGSTEVLNGIFNLWRKPGGNKTPAIVNDNSRVSITASTTDARKLAPRPNVFIEEIRGDQTKQLHWNDLPRRDDKDLIVVPLYVGELNQIQNN